MSGCLKLMLLGLACVALLIVGVILLIDSTNSGDKVKKGVVEVIDAARGSGDAPPGQPEIVEKVVEKVVEVEVEKIVEVEKKEPLPSRFVERRKVDTAELWNGLTVESAVETREGEFATAERERDGGFQLAVELKLSIPKHQAHRTGQIESGIAQAASGSGENAEEREGFTLLSCALRGQDEAGAAVPDPLGSHSVPAQFFRLRDGLGIDPS